MKNVLVIIIGLMTLALAYHFGKETYQFARYGIVQTGKVVGVYYSTDREGNTFYSSTIRFTTEDNQAIEFNPNIASSQVIYKKGELVKVVYLADRPHEARINSFFVLWMKELILIILGMGCVLYPGMVEVRANVGEWHWNSDDSDYDYDDDD